MFNRFRIKDYKCFQGENSLDFAIPISEKVGSGITYIVGSNNSGKTTLIEGLSIRDKTNIRTSERVNNTHPEFVLYENDQIVRKCCLIRQESSTIQEHPKIADDKTFQIISSRRHWNSIAHHIYPAAGQGFRETHKFENRNNNLEVASELRTIEADTASYKEYVQLVQRIIPEFTKFAVAYEDNHYIEYITSSGVRHKADLLGDGVITAIRILLQLYVQKPNPLIIDEPELSLHPTAQRRLLKVLAEYSQTRQIILSTHSPYMLDWTYLMNGAVCNRIVKESDRTSKIYPVKNFERYAALINANNWQMPYAMDEVAKEIFFMDDGVLFLEGQEDVGLLKSEPELIGINVFGYGVRGKNNFKFALTLAKELGYKKISCILDAGESENAIKSSLEADFPEYKIIQWNKSDIRDKDAYTTSAKTGYYNQNGSKKPLSELDDFNTKLSQLKAYMSDRSAHQVTCCD